MSEEKNYTRYQQNVIRRYYDNRDTMSRQRLGEIVTDLFLCESEKKKERLWEQAAKDLEAAGANPAFMKKVLEERDVKRLAELVNTLQ